MSDIQGEVYELFAESRKKRNLTANELVKQYRRFPNGFKFYFRSASDEPEESFIIDAFLAYYFISETEIVDIQSIAIWYECNVPSFQDEEGDYMPMSESLILRAIEKFGSIENQLISSTITKTTLPTNRRDRCDRISQTINTVRNLIICFFLSNVAIAIFLTMIGLTLFKKLW